MGVILHFGLYLIYLLIFLWAISKMKFFRDTGESVQLFRFFFLLKVVGGLTLTLVYTYYYSDQTRADIYRYFNDSKIITSLLFQKPLIWFKVITGMGMNEPEVFKYLLRTQYFSHSIDDIATNNAFIIRLISVLSLFSGANIYINTLLINFLSFLGLTALYKAFAKSYPHSEKLFLSVVYLVPSVIFWGSGLLKEQFALVLIGFFFYILFANPKYSLSIRILLAIFFLAMSVLLKPMIALGMLLTSMVAFVFSLKLGKRASVLSGIALVFVIFILSQAMGDSVCRVFLEKRNEFIELGISENAGSSFEISFVNTDCNTLFPLVWPGLINSIFRPFIWEGGNLFELAIGIENTIILSVWLICMIIYFRLPSRSQLPVTLACLSFALTTHLIIGITVPITGAIVHYRIIATIFLLAGGCFFIDYPKLRQLIGRFL